jgi:hypothetical protein
MAQKAQTTAQKAQQHDNNITIVEPFALQRCGFDESMLLEGWVAFRMIFPTPSSKRFNRFNKLK